jgi:hypothetical protein
MRFELALPGALAIGVVALPWGCGRVGYDLSAVKKSAPEREKDASTDVAGSADGGTSSAGGTASGGAVVSSGGAGGASSTSSGGTSGAGGDSGVPADGGAPVSDAGDSGADAASLDGAPACGYAPQPLADWCTKIPELTAPAVIDGALDCGLVTRTITPQAYNVMGTPDSIVDYAIAWSSEGLYFYAKVHDPVVLPAPLADEVWQGDSVELYVDSDGVYGAPPAYDSATRQLVIAAPAASVPSTRGEIFAVPPTGVAWTSTRFGAFSSSDGYVVEALVTAEDLGLTTWALVADGHIGFDVGLNVSAETPDGGTQGTRIGQYFLRVDPSDAVSGHPFQSVAAFCNPTLVAR